MNADSGIALSELRVDDSATHNDLLGVPVVRPRVAESTAHGAAGLTVGF